MFTNEEAKQAITQRYKDSLTESRVAFFKALKIALNGTFGEENNQIMSPLEVMERSSRTYDASSGLTVYRVIIKFPQITIKNSHMSSHVIKELYVRFTIHPFNLRLNSTVSGCRGVCTPEEFDASYQHSHISVGPEHGGWGDFCLGSGPLNQSINSLITQPNTPSMTNQWKAFLYNIKSMVAWESLEGSPYRKLETISQGRDRSPRRTLSMFNFNLVRGDSLKDIMQRFLSIPDLEKKMKMEIVGNSGEVVYSIPNDLNKELARLLSDKPGSTCYNSSNGQYDTINQQSQNSSARNTQLESMQLGYFKGERIIRKIQKNGTEEQQTSINQEKYTRNEIISTITQIFNDRLRVPVYKIADTLYRSTLGDNAQVRVADSTTVSENQPG